MSDNILREETDLISGSHSTVVIRGDWGTPFADPIADNTLVSVSEVAPAELWISTGDQYGPYEVTVRMLAEPPGMPAHEWEDVVEVSIHPTSELVVTEMIDNVPAIPLTDGSGSYRLRVSARGRLAVRDYEEDDDLDSEEPIEWYLLEVWAAEPADLQVLRLTSSYAAAQLNPPPPNRVDEGEAGLAAASRIGRDVGRLADARVLSGATGTARAERTIRGTRRKLFPMCSHLTTWSHWWVEGASWSWIGVGGADYALNEPAWALSHEHRDQFTGRYGAVRTTFIEVDKPARAVRTWEWMVSDFDQTVSIDKLRPFLPGPTTLTVSLEQSKDTGGEPWTTIRIEHTDLPVEWIEDVSIYWDYQLAIADMAGFGMPRGSVSPGR